MSVCGEHDGLTAVFRGFGKKKDSKDGKASGSGGPIKTPNTGKQPGAEGEGGVQTETTIDMDKTKRIQGQLDEVTGIMNQNIDAAQKRGADLDQMQDQMADLEQGANQFNKNSAQVKKNLWYKNMKMTIMITIIVLVIIAVIVAVIIMQSKDK